MPNGIYAWVNFIRLLKRNGDPTGYAFHDTIIGQDRTVGGTTYKYLGFNIDVGASAAGGDRSSVTLQLGNEDIGINIVTEACANRYRLENKCYRLNTTTELEDVLYSTELWECQSYTSSVTTILLQLRPPGNAVDPTNPSRTLSSRLVGALPAVGGVSLQ